MDARLPDVWRKLEYLAGILETHAPDFKTITHQDLTDIRDDLNDTAQLVQTIRDESFTE